MIYSLCLGPVACAQKVCASEKKLSGYCLEQESSKSGPVQVTVSANAVRFDAPGYACISKGPLWDVVMWRKDRPQYAQLPYKVWLTVNFPGASVERSEITKSIIERHYERKGQKMVIYRFPKAVSTGTSMLFQSRDVEGISRELQPQVDCLEWSDDIHPGAVLDRFCGLPPLKGIPLGITSSGKAYREWELRTKKLVHSDNISPTLFMLPSGLKKVPFSAAIFISDNTKGVIDDYFSGAK
jgi:hypothetical protein